MFRGVSSYQISRQQVEPLLRYLFSKWRPSAILDVYKLEILTVGTVRRFNMRHRAKFRAKRSNSCGKIDVFDFLKMAAVHHLGFLKVRNDNCRYGSDGQYASLCQFSCQSVKPCRDMADFRFLRMAAVRHVVFLIIVNFTYQAGSKGQYESSYQIACRSVKPFRRYGHFLIFQDGGRPPSWDFYMLEIWLQSIIVSIISKFNILHIRLENAYSRPKNDPQNGEQYERYPERYSCQFRVRKHVVCDV